MKKLIYIVFLSMISIILCGCSQKQEEVFQQEEAVLQEDKYFKIVDLGEFEYYYAIYNLNGEIVKEGTTFRIEPFINYIDEDTIEIHTGAGTDVFFCTYYDILHDRFSESYESPVAANYDKVAYVEYRDTADGNKILVLVVKDIFADGYGEEYHLDFSLAVSPVNHAEFLDRDTLYLSYLSGDLYEERVCTINLKDKSYRYDLEGDWLVYDSVSNFHDKRDLPYADELTFEIIKAAYAKIEFSGEFLQGDSEVYDEYRRMFLKLLQNEIAFLDDDTGEEIYLADYRELTGDHEYNAENYEYYFFDVDEDGMPELGIYNPGYPHTKIYYKYNSDTEKCILWYVMDGSWEEWFGSRKWANPWGGLKDMYFVRFGQNREVELRTYCFSTWFNDESLHLVMMPKYADKEKETPVTDEMKAQGVFEQSSGQWYFRLTDEQYDEVTAAYSEAYYSAGQKIKEVTYTYEELFGSLDPILTEEDAARWYDMYDHSLENGVQEYLYTHSGFINCYAINVYTGEVIRERYENPETYLWEYNEEYSRIMNYSE